MQELVQVKNELILVKSQLKTVVDMLNTKGLNNTQNRQFHIKPNNFANRNHPYKDQKQFTQPRYSRPDERYNQVVCYNCNKRGHIARFCRERT